uniref:NACHT, LRR and PYD domains-containing protein 13 n=1 Tax=Lygus hesperus TaxID=30085 RepID=A0A0A9YG29_LYGHE
MTSLTSKVLESHDTFTREMYQVKSKNGDNNVAGGESFVLSKAYLAECLAQHVKPHMKLLELFKNTQYARNLTTLSLSHYKLGIHGLSPLAPLLSHFYRLSYIDLSYNDLSNRAVHNLCEYLRYQLSLQTLNLAYNPLDDECTPFLL